MKRSRIGSALAAAMAGAAGCLLLWPHACEAGATMAAQDELAELADVGLNSALRNNRAPLEQNIEAALAENDADRAKPRDG
jgi:hypothetical protein